MEVLHFEELQVEFMQRIQQAVYCNVATVDRLNRPRSRVMHLVWDGPTGWGITSPQSHKSRHLLHNPAVSLAYVSAPYKPVYVDCTAAWVDSASEKQRIWELHQNTPAPLGFDPAPHYGSIENPLFGLLCFKPWRVELGDLYGEALIWRP
jgi:general stress protein 26